MRDCKRMFRNKIVRYQSWGKLKMWYNKHEETIYLVILMSSILLIMSIVAILAYMVSAMWLI